MYQQNTPEWLEMRKGKIGASDAPVIMEKSPWTTPYQLWEQKLGMADYSKPSESSHDIARKQRGLDLEPLARLELEKLTGLFLLPSVRMHSNLPWMMASLDAIDPEGKYIAEIKCPGAKDHNQALEGNIPDKYYPQLQHQLEVCQLEMIDYFSFDGTKGVLLKVFRDDAYIKKMLQKEQEFWECVQELSPPAMTDKDYQPISSEQWNKNAQDWLVINSQIKQLEKREEELRKLLISTAGNKSAIGSGVRATKFLRKGNVDYNAIPELQNVEVEKYRKKPIECWKLSTV
jgi:putative phage-type endonuclease